MRPILKRPPLMHAVRLASAACVCLLLAGCGGHEAAPEFAPPDYSYLPKLRLSIGTLAVEDHATQPSGPDDLAQTAPVPPDQALQRLARDRLIAAGTSGSGVFTIDQASITGSGGGALDGRLAVHLDILTAGGGHAGYAEAHVSRQFIPGTGTSDRGTRAQLYDLTRQMMQDMNVELEYQVRRSLRDWLVDASGAPAAGVEQQTLPPPGPPPYNAPPYNAPVTNMPGGTPVGTTPVGVTPLGSASPGSGPVPLAPPSPEPAPSEPTSPELPDPATPPRSPPPSFLQPPSDSVPASPPAATGGY